MQSVKEAESSLGHGLVRDVVLPVWFALEISRDIKDLTCLEAECTVELFHFKGSELEILSKVAEKLPHIEEPLQRRAIKQDGLRLRLLWEVVGAMQNREELDELVFDRVLNRILLDKFWVELLEDLELILEFAASGLLGLLGLGLLIRFSLDEVLAGAVLLQVVVSATL